MNNQKQIKNQKPSGQLLKWQSILTITLCTLTILGELYMAYLDISTNCDNKGMGCADGKGWAIAIIMIPTLLLLFLSFIGILDISKQRYRLKNNELLNDKNGTLSRITILLFISNLLIALATILIINIINGNLHL